MREVHDEETIVDAIFYFTDNGLSWTKTSKKWGIPRQTLIDRFNGTGTRKEGAESQQRLPNVQEQRIADCILRRELLGYASTAADVRSVAESIPKAGGDTSPLGQNWIKSFKTRNPSVHIKIGHKQVAARFSAFTPKSVN